MLYNLKMYINFINGEDNSPISSLKISNPKVIALYPQVETEVEITTGQLLIAA